MPIRPAGVGTRRLPSVRLNLSLTVETEVVAAGIPAQELLQKDLRLLGIQSESERAVRQLREKRISNCSSLDTSSTAGKVTGNNPADKTESTLSDPDSLELQASLPDPFAGLGE